jgi:hypothetical protein
MSTLLSQREPAAGFLTFDRIAAEKKIDFWIDPI